MLSYHCYHFKYIELNMISLKSVVERLLLNMWQTSSGIKKDNFDFLSKFDVLKRWSPSSLFTTPNGKRGWPGHVSNAWKISYWEWNMSSLPHYWYDCSYLCYHINHLVVRMKSYLIIFQLWATQNEFLVSHPFNSEKWSARADSNFIFYFFLYRESWMKMAWFTKPSQFAWFTKPSHFATGSEHGGIAYTFEVDNW